MSVVPRPVRAGRCGTLLGRREGMDARKEAQNFVARSARHKGTFGRVQYLRLERQIGGRPHISSLKGVPCLQTASAL
jgi:hypothetical protein